MLRILALLVAVSLSFAWAQGTPAPPPSATPPGAAPTPQGGPLVGAWTTTLPANGGPAIEGRLLVAPDGRYREEMVVQGQLAGFWEGSYTLAPDGTLTQNETATSPQLCVGGQCQPNEGPATTVSRIVQLSADAFTLAYQDPASGQSFQITWRRAAGAPGAAAPPPVGGAPQDPAGSANPLGVPAGAGASADPWAGSWSDGDLTLVLAGPDASYLERGGARYPLQLQGDAQRLQGVFVSDGTPFPVTLERPGDRVILGSGGSRFELAPAPSAGPARPANPLGN